MTRREELEAKAQKLVDGWQEREALMTWDDIKYLAEVAWANCCINAELAWDWMRRRVC